MRFRRGAFIAEKRVTPMFLKYDYRFCSPAFDIIEFWPIAIFTMSTWRNKCYVNVMPDFEPNEYMYKTHKSHGNERWEVYAWAVRDIMAKTGNFGISSTPLK